MAIELSGELLTAVGAAASTVAGVVVVLWKEKVAEIKRLNDVNDSKDKKIEALQAAAITALEKQIAATQDLKPTLDNLARSNSELNALIREKARAPI